MRVPATGEEIRERGGYCRVRTRWTLWARVLYILEASCFVIRRQNQLCGAGPLYMWVVGASFQA
jgi:hypothetical protein